MLLKALLPFSCIVIMVLSLVVILFVLFSLLFYHGEAKLLKLSTNPTPV
jgi:hypothetical protein